jgi:hypothetical protein
MTDQHPITPPPELVQQWYDNIGPDPGPFESFAIAAARWGADQELEACCKLLELSDSNAREFLYSARRPKPPSLKEQALAELESLRGDANAHGLGFDAPVIRRALEQLDD